MKNIPEKKKKILLVSYYFFPENTPRAFRATELANRLSADGHEVTVFLPDSPCDYGAFTRNHPMEIVRVPSGFLLNRNAKARKNTSHQSKAFPKSGRLSIFRGFFKFFFNLVYLGGNSFEFWVPLFWKLAREKRKFDLLLSNALPFSVHFGVWAALWFRPRLAKIYVAEYGDPFAANPQFSFSRWYAWVEGIVLRKFNFIVIPTIRALPFFEAYKPKKFIKIIPQGMDLKSVKRGPYRRNLVSTFAYAGIFYSKVRNPINFIDFLRKIPDDFQFILFTDVENNDNMACVRYYGQLLGKRMKVQGLLQRKRCIYRLSQMDFLVNVDFHPSDRQLPSKLIDYALAGRPVFTLNQRRFDKELFLDYLRGDFRRNTPLIRLGDYDVHRTTEALLKMID